MTRAVGRRCSFAVSSLLFLLGSPLPAASADAGWVELRVTDHRAGIDDFTALWVQLATVSLHLRGESRSEGWLMVVDETAPVDIVPLKHGRWSLVGRKLVAASRYDAVKVQFGEIRGELRHGGSTALAPVNSTVRTDVIIEEGTTRIILIDLYVDDQSDHDPGRYELKIRRVKSYDDAHSNAP